MQTAATHNFYRQHDRPHGVRPQLVRAQTGAHPIDGVLYDCGRCANIVVRQLRIGNRPDCVRSRLRLLHGFVDFDVYLMRLVLRPHGHFPISPIAFSIVLRSSLYVKYMGLERLTSVYGLGSMCMGFAALAGTPAARMFQSIYGGYTAPFAFSGGCHIISGCLLLLLKYALVWERRN